MLRLGFHAPAFRRRSADAAPVGGFHIMSELPQKLFDLAAYKSCSLIGLFVQGIGIGLAKSIKLSLRRKACFAGLPWTTFDSVASYLSSGGTA